jgi:EAL domain-containing protein (putative c-di-GMP-specific phosphodiesterase class I)
VAEETGLIRPLGAWVIRETVRQIRSWNLAIPASSAIRVSVNVSAAQFDQGNLVEEVRDALRNADVAPTSLALEVTESLVLRNRTLTAHILAELRALGVTIYLDDFGTGYSSLSLLHELPVDTLKIDKSFVGRIGEAGENSEIVQSVAALGHGLGLSVLAEGIETAVQLAQLRALRCEFGQGWYFYGAVPAEEASMLLRSGLPSRHTGETPRSTPGTPENRRRS